MKKKSPYSIESKLGPGWHPVRFSGNALRRSKSPYRMSSSIERINLLTAVWRYIIIHIKHRWLLPVKIVRKPLYWWEKEPSNN